MPKFNIEYEGQSIFVDGGHGSPYMLRFPDKSYLLLDCSVDGWFIECATPELWYNRPNIQRLGKLIDAGELLAEETAEKEMQQQNN